MKETNSKIRYFSGNHASVYIPASITKDSMFPFDLKTQKIKIKIEGERLTIEKV